MRDVLSGLMEKRNRNRCKNHGMNYGKNQDCSVNKFT
jgi:hypothetical protein